MLEPVKATTMSIAMANWVGKIPETAQNQEMLSSWKEAPKNRKEAVRFLAQSLAKHHQSQKEWGAARGPLGGDSDDDNFLERVPKGKRHEKANESEDSDDRNAKSLRGPSKEKEERLSVSESESEPAAEPYASWNQAEAGQFVTEVDVALKSLDGPQGAQDHPSRLGYFVWHSSRSSSAAPHAGQTIGCPQEVDKVTQSGNPDSASAQPQGTG